MTRNEQIKRYRALGWSYDQIGEALGCTRQVVSGVLYRERVRLYEKCAAGEAVPRHIRAMILGAVKKRGDITRLAREWGVHPWTVHRWRREADA